MADINSIIADVTRRLDTHVQLTLSDLTDDIIELTPVDTGFLHSSWYYSPGGGSLSVIGNPNAGSDKASSKSSVRAALQLAYGTGAATPTAAAVYNNAHYADTIEAGRVGPGVGSVQAPAGMMRINLLRFPGISDRVADGLRK